MKLKQQFGTETWPDASPTELLRYKFNLLDTQQARNDEIISLLGRLIEHVSISDEKALDLIAQQVWVLETQE